MTWGFAFGGTPPRPCERQGAATATAASLPNCRSRNADREKDDAKSEKRQGGECPHFHGRSPYGDEAGAGDGAGSVFGASSGAFLVAFSRVPSLLLPWRCS